MRNNLLVLAIASAFAVSCATTGGDTRPSSNNPPRDANAIQPLSTAPSLPAAPTIRVGLLSDQSTTSFARIDGGYVLVAPDGAWSLRRGFTASGPVQGAPASYGVQVAALSDKTSAENLAAKIQSEANQSTTLLFDAGGGVYKVIAGSFPTQDAARQIIGGLTSAGYGKDMMVVARPSDQKFSPMITVVDDEGQRREFNADSILVLPGGDKPISIGGSPYRGGARLFVNSRGTLNVINELNLEDYVRGVVPSEMGPKVYDELEAIKAQALAARTYAVRRLGEYRPEGFDICPTPACQVYKGISIEEPLSDQATKETAGMIIAFNGEPIDALFTAACGGATSDVATMFPGRNEPYLKRVSCIEGDLHTLAGRADGPLQSETQLDARLFELLTNVQNSGSWSARDVVAATEAAAKLAGVTLPVKVMPAQQNAVTTLTPPASARRGDVLRYLADALGAAAHGRALTYTEDRSYFFPSREVASDRVAAAAFLIKYRIIPAQQIDRVDLDAAMPRDELYALLASWLRKRDLINEATGRITSLEGRRVTIKVSGGKSQTFDIPTGAALYRKTLDRIQEYATLSYMIGDRATVVRRRDGTIAAVVFQTNYDGAAYDRTSSYSSWVRSYRADELLQTINRRNPLQQLTDLRPVAVDPSQRLSALDVIAENGRVINLKGIIIRWSLNVPDNLFTFEKSVDSDGVARYTFFGKGWGHGTGMCQEGAYGMAMRGWKAVDIIKHYYTGVDVVPLASITQK